MLCIEPILLSIVNSIDLCAVYTHFARAGKRQFGAGGPLRQKRITSMKVNIEVDCSPEEMRRFMGLPDVSDVNRTYVDGVVNAMKGTSNVDQLQNIAKNIAPMGEMGLRFFQQIMDAAAAGASGKPKSSD
jgi:hypothetical protein